MPVSSSTVHFETGITQERQCGKSCSEVLLAHEIAEDFEDQLDPDEFVDTEEIGYGNGGLVFKSVHIPTRTVVAKKIFISRIPSESRRKMLQRELQTLQRCCSPYILHYYGSVVSECHVSLILEYMDLGSLSDILQAFGPVPEHIIGKIAHNVLNGLGYLYHDLNMIHRDLKPSNILVNSVGEVKLCDFGDSVELINSKAGSVVGTMGYMAPERVQGHDYTVTSDVWSLGVTLLELATGLFPFAHSGQFLRRRTEPSEYGLASIAIVELLEAIINDPLPRLDPSQFTVELCDFVNSCLIRDPLHRPTPMELKTHPLIQKYDSVNLANWVESLKRPI